MCHRQFQIQRINQWKAQHCYIKGGDTMAAYSNENCLFCTHPLAVAPLFWWKEKGKQEALIWIGHYSTNLAYFYQTSHIFSMESTWKVSVFFHPNRKTRWASYKLVPTLDVPHLFWKTNSISWSFFTRFRAVQKVIFESRNSRISAFLWPSSPLKNPNLSSKISEKLLSFGTYPAFIFPSPFRVSTSNLNNSI